MSAVPLTPADLKGLAFGLIFHARLGGGGYIIVRRCEAHPRLTIQWKRDNGRAPERRTACVDGVECASIEMVVERLNAPPRPDPTAPAVQQLTLDLG